MRKVYGIFTRSFKCVDERAEFFGSCTIENSYRVDVRFGMSVPFHLVLTLWLFLQKYKHRARAARGYCLGSLPGWLSFREQSKFNFLEILLQCSLNQSKLYVCTEKSFWFLTCQNEIIPHQPTPNNMSFPQKKLAQRVILLCYVGRETGKYCTCNDIII